MPLSVDDGNLRGLAGSLGQGYEVEDASYVAVR